MIFNNPWKQLEQALQRNPGARFWWRDDDVGVARQSPRDLARLTETLEILSRRGAPAVFGVVPKDFAKLGAPSAAILRKYKNAFVALHGIEHKNNAPKGQCKTEFPAGCDVHAILPQILNHARELHEIFGGAALDVFIPPHNEICPALADALARNGFIISAHNPPPRNLPWNIDIDFIRWRHGGKFKGARKVINQICELLDSGAETIGFNAHFWVNNRRAMKFFDRLIEVIGGDRFYV